MNKIILILTISQIFVAECHHLHQLQTHANLLQSTNQFPEPFSIGSKTNNNSANNDKNYDQQKLGAERQLKNPSKDQDFKNVDQFIKKQKPELQGAQLISVKKQVVSGWKYNVQYSKAGVTYRAIVDLEPDRKKMQLRSWAAEQTSESRQQVQEQKLEKNLEEK